MAFDPELAERLRAVPATAAPVPPTAWQRHVVS